MLKKDDKIKLNPYALFLILILLVFALNGEIKKNFFNMIKKYFLLVNTSE